jgi:adenine-specific DNA-methyltransferase
MGRRWIIVELGDHIHSHIIPRMVKVVNGNDPGGITASENWRGGGGFRYYRLAPTLVEKDRFGNPTINPKYHAAMLAEAMCKVMGYQYAPNGQIFWQQGHATENDYLYVTTQTLTHEQLAQLSEEVGESRSLLICCSAFRGKPAMFPNLTVEKIPSAILNRCEWGKDDYSLEVANLLQAPGPAPKPQMALFEEAPPK